MKTAIYIEDGVSQIVLSPETPFERNALQQFMEEPLNVKVINGSFYDCRGEWVRQKPYYHQLHEISNTMEHDQSIIIRVGKVDEEKV